MNSKFLPIVVILAWLSCLDVLPSGAEPAGVFPNQHSRADEDSSSASATAGATATSTSGSISTGPGAPPAPGGVVPPVGGVVPPVGGGLGLGLHKGVNFDFSSYAGLLPGLFGGGLPLGGGIPPIGDGGVVPDGGSGFLGMPAFGTSYFPSTWFGSALAAKGDLLFPIVIFLFIIIGIWTVVKFLLALIIPLVAEKFALASAFKGGKGRFFRSTSGADSMDPKADHQQRVDDMTHRVLHSVEMGDHGDDDQDEDDFDQDDDDF